MRPTRSSHYPSSVANGTARILLVDDEQSIQTLLSYPLRKDGYHVTSALDGGEALQRFEEGRFDLVILDLMLPRLDGVEVCRQLRTHSQVPIIMLTAKGSETDKVAGLEVGADDYITKPFSMREFRSRVKAALRRSRMGGETPGDESIESGELTIDFATSTLRRCMAASRSIWCLISASPTVVSSAVVIAGTFSRPQKVESRVHC